MSKEKIIAGTAFLAALVGALVFNTYSRNLQEARIAAQTGSMLLYTAEGPVEYAERGEGTPALVIHGAGGGWDQGLFIAEMLGPGLRVIAPSRFGYLRTPVPADASPAAQAEAHAALLDRLDVAKAIVVGVSAGAPSAIEMALRHPDRVSALILLVPRSYAPGQTVGVDETQISNKIVLDTIMLGADFAFWSLSHLSRGSVVRFLGVPSEVEAHASAQARADVTRLIESILPLSARLPGLRNDGATKLSPWPLQRIAAPTLIVSAKDDLYVTLPGAQFTARGIPGAKLLVFETGGHLFVDRKTQLSEAVAAFVKEVTEPPPNGAS
jgi:pimeloyl-ACP methyl ester carboxylesterase